MTAMACAHLSSNRHHGSSVGMLGKDGEMVELMVELWRMVYCKDRETVELLGARKERMAIQ